MNYIIIQNSTASKVENAVSRMADLYIDSGFTNSIIIHHASFNQFLISFPYNPDFERFCYFVNYLRYPEGIKDYDPFVYGIWNVTQPIKGIFAEDDEKLLIYVSKSDKEYDNVLIQNSKGNTYQYSFSGKISEIKEGEHNYIELTIEPENYEEYMEIIPSVEAKEKTIKPWWKFW